MKTAISLPDVVFARAEQAARIHGWSRSELFTRALVYYLDQGVDSAAERTRRMDAVIEREGVDAFALEDLGRAQLNRLADEGW